MRRGLTTAGLLFPRKLSNRSDNEVENGGLPRGKFVALLLIPPALGAAIAHRTGAAHAAKDFLISSVGPYP